MGTKKNWKYAKDIKTGDYININNRGREVVIVSSTRNQYTIVCEEMDLVNVMWIWCTIKAEGTRKIIMADTAGINKWEKAKSPER